MALGIDLYLAAQTGTYSTSGPSVSLSGGTAFTGFQTLAAAGAVNSSEYYCTLTDGAGNSAVWKATYSSTGPTLTRSEAIHSVGTIADSATVNLYIWSRTQKPSTAGLALMEGADAPAQRTSLGLGDVATRNVGTAAGTAAAGDHGHEGHQKYHGFPQPYQVSLSYSAANRQLTITPSGATFDVWIKGTKYTKSGAQVSVAHANTTGNYYIYYNESGVLTTGTDPWDLTAQSPVAYIYYNSSLADAIVLFELHTAERNTEWHLSQHFALGTFVRSGLEISGYTLNTSTNAACSFGVASGIIVDEDIEYAVSAVVDGGPYTILWRTGANDWTWTTNDTKPFKVGATYIQYNQNNAGTYQLTELASARWVNYWVFATTELNAQKQVFVVPSQTLHTSLALAQAESVGSLAWGNFLIPEAAAVWKVTYAANSTYTAVTGRVRVVEVSRISATRAQLTGNFASGTHNALTSRDAADAHPASSITNTPAGSIVATTVQAAIDELDAGKQPLDGELTALAGLTSAADKVPYFTGAGSAALADFTAAGRALVAAASADAQRALLSVGPGMKNRLVGGDFTTNPWQRGTTFTALVNGQYCADIWAVSHSSDGGVDVLKTADAPTNAQAGYYTQHCVHLDVTTADASLTSSQFYLLRTNLECVNTFDLGFGQSGTRYITISFWHKHTKTGTYCVALENNDTTRSWIAEYTQDVTDTWEFESITIPVCTDGTWTYTVGQQAFRLYWVIAAGSGLHSTPGSWLTANKLATANQVNGLDSTANSFKFALMQLEAGQVATPFEYRHPQIELMICRRSFRKQAVWVGTSTAPTCFSIDMRLTPTVSGGGTGFTYATNTTADTLICYQTTAGVQTLSLTA